MQVASESHVWTRRGSRPWSGGGRENWQGASGRGGVPQAVLGSCGIRLYNPRYIASTICYKIPLFDGGKRFILVVYIHPTAGARLVALPPR